MKTTLFIHKQSKDFVQHLLWFVYFQVRHTRKTQFNVNTYWLNFVGYMSCSGSLVPNQCRGSVALINLDLQQRAEEAVLRGRGRLLRLRIEKHAGAPSWCPIWLRKHTPEVAYSELCRTPSVCVYSVLSVTNIKQLKGALCNFLQ